MKKLLLLVAVASVSGAMAMDKDSLANKIALNKLKQKQGHRRTTSDLGKVDRDLIPKIDTSSWKNPVNSNSNLNDSFDYEGGNLSFESTDSTPVKKLKKIVKSNWHFRQDVKQPEWLTPRKKGKTHAVKGGKMNPCAEPSVFRSGKFFVYEDKDNKKK